MSSARCGNSIPKTLKRPMTSCASTAISTITSELTNPRPVRTSHRMTPSRHCLMVAYSLKKSLQTLGWSTTTASSSGDGLVRMESCRLTGITTMSERPMLGMPLLFNWMRDYGNSWLSIADRSLRLLRFRVYMSSPCLLVII